jgi:endonuclease/exonuclease/phosphatase (EEP) superfamily protein YafD
MVWTKKLAVLLVGCLLILLSMAIGSSIGGVDYIPERLSHFQLQYWLVAIFLLSVIATSKYKPAILLGLVAISVLSANLLTWYVPVNTQRTPFLKVLSSNVWINNQNYPALLELVRKEDPDIAMFFEVTPPGQQQLDTLNDILPYSAGRDTGALIYTKLSLNGTKIWFNNPQYPTTTIIENLQHQNKSFTLVGTHPASPHSEQQFEIRNQQLANLAEYLAASSEALIVGGDFNVTMWSPYYRQFIDRSKLVNARRGFGVAPSWTPAELRSLPNFLQPWLSIPIDHIFTRSGKFELHTTAMKAGPNIGSDHLPIIAKIGVVDRS